MMVSCFRPRRGRSTRLVWPDTDGFKMQFEWEPVVFAINDGQDTITAVFTPQNYGATSDEATYAVEGLYTFADSGETVNARLLFQNGNLVQVFGVTGADLLTPEWQAGLTPEAKAGIVGDWARREGPIAMVGDGLNDGLVLAAAAGSVLELLEERRLLAGDAPVGVDAFNVSMFGDCFETLLWVRGEGQKLARELVTQAEALSGESRQVVAIIVNRVATARLAHELLGRKHGARAVLFTGRMRPADRLPMAWR